MMWAGLPSFMGGGGELKHRDTAQEGRRGTEHDEASSRMGVEVTMGWDRTSGDTERKMVQGGRGNVHLHR